MMRLLSISMIVLLWLPASDAAETLDAKAFLQRLQAAYGKTYSMDVVMETQLTEGQTTTHVRLAGKHQRRDARAMRVELDATVKSQWQIEHGHSSVTKTLKLMMVKDGTYLWCDFATDGMVQPQVMRMGLDHLQQTFADHQDQIPVIFQSPIADPDLLVQTISETMELKAQRFEDGVVEISGPLSPQVIALLDVAHLKAPRLELVSEDLFPLAFRIFEGDQAVVLLHHANYVEMATFDPNLFVFELGDGRTVNDFGKVVEKQVEAGEHDKNDGRDGL